MQRKAHFEKRKIAGDCKQPSAGVMDESQEPRVADSRSGEGSGRRWFSCRCSPSTMRTGRCWRKGTRLRVRSFRSRCSRTIALPSAPDRFPEMFKWKGHAPFVEVDDVSITNWLEIYGDRTAWEWREAGRLEFNGPRYFLAEAPRRHAYVSVFGPVPGLMLVPLIAPLYALDHDLHTEPARYASIVKLGSAGLVAGCAVLIFLIASRRTTRGRALLLAATYGLATCAWAVSSQNIWQQTVNQVLLTAGADFFLGDVERRGVAAWAGLFLGAATACRVTSALVLIAAALHLAVHHRRSLLPFVAAALPMLFLTGVYNAYYFGNPLVFAQGLAGPAIAQEKTGSSALWQTPLYVGALGLLASPSRGLLIFSPVLAPAGWGLVRSIADPAWRSLRALGLAAFATMALQCAWFDWWGGHAYGYRPWLDVMPYLVLLLLPVLDELTTDAAPARAVRRGFRLVDERASAGRLGIRPNLEHASITRGAAAGRPETRTASGRTRGQGSRGSFERKLRGARRL